MWLWLKYRWPSAIMNIWSFCPTEIIGLLCLNVIYVTMWKIILGLIFKVFRKDVQFLFLDGIKILLQAIQNWS